MAHLRPDAPAGNGELVAEPAYREWADLVAQTRAARESWDFQVAQEDVADFVTRARAEAVELATSFSERLGVPLPAGADPAGPLVMTGHQPELFHPGIWVKDFFLQRLREDLNATAIDAVVDTDTFDTLAIEAPCMRPELMRCREYLAVAEPDVTYCGAPALTRAEVDTFVELSLKMLETLPAPSVPRHFSAFAEAMRSSSEDSANLAEFVTFARRRYELTANTDYLEWPVSWFARSTAFARFVSDVAGRAGEFAGTMNDCLARYRGLAGIRGTAQPFPDLETAGEAVELPFWLVQDGRRGRLWSAPAQEGVSLRTSPASEDEVILLPAGAAAAGDVLSLSGLVVAPRAVTLTMYLRMFVADLFIHGVGGGRYDAVTDDIVRAWFGVEPPRFAVASLTLHLPLGVHVVEDSEIEEVRSTLNRLTHNPDQLVGGLTFDDPAERSALEGLARRKKELVGAIAAPEADKKSLGAQIRAVNEEMSTMLGPLRAELEERLDDLVAQQAAAELLTDRMYPFCYFSPLEVADKVG